MKGIREIREAERNRRIDNGKEGSKRKVEAWGERRKEMEENSGERMRKKERRMGNGGQEGKE